MLQFIKVKKNNWFSFIYKKNLQPIFIYGVMFFKLFLLKEMIQCNFSIQFDFIYKKIIFTTLIWKIIFTILFTKKEKKSLILFLKIKF